jgi:hypothetical protein
MLISESPVVIDGFKKWTVLATSPKVLMAVNIRVRMTSFVFELNFQAALNSLKNIEGLYGGCSGHCFSLSSMAAVTEI